MEHDVYIIYLNITYLHTAPEFRLHALDKL